MAPRVARVRFLLLVFVQNLIDGGGHKVALLVTAGNDGVSRRLAEARRRVPAFFSFDLESCRRPLEE
jgi:hypothetical protein